MHRRRRPPSGELLQRAVCRPPPIRTAAGEFPVRTSPRVAVCRVAVCRVPVRRVRRAALHSGTRACGGEGGGARSVLRRLSLVAAEEQLRAVERRFARGPERG